MELLYEGKGKKIYQAKAPHELIMYFKDDLTAFNALKKGSFSGKGELNCQISTRIFDLLKRSGVLSHHLETISKNEMRVLKTQIIPLEVVVRNISAGSFAQKFQIASGEPLKTPLVEYYFKNDELKDPFVSEGQILHFGWCSDLELQNIKKEALRINEVLVKNFAKRSLMLVDFKIEFGRTADGKVILADEISPDCMRLWDQKTGERLDKDRFRMDLGDVGAGYSRILKELETLQEA